MMRAAVANGADAVYFGLEDFNARRRAENFTLASLPETMAYLHSRNVRGYVAMNTLIFSQELPRAAEFVAGIARSGADAVIVQDLGLARLIREIAPSLPIHASTQMTQTHQAGLQGLAELGISRVILARELSLEMIRAIAGSPPVAHGRIELEVFVHGALCISYSGQCLASEGLLGRSANRGQCGQVCRLPYQLVVDAPEHGQDARATHGQDAHATTGQVRELGKRQYLLSPQDLAAYPHVAELCRLGIRGLKIEGRLKSPAYVAAVVQVYRAAIDEACGMGILPVVAASSVSLGQQQDQQQQQQLKDRAGTALEHTGKMPVPHKTYQPTPQQRTQLEHTFSRGSTSGYLRDPRGGDLVEGEFPASRGIGLGRVASVRGQFVLLETDPPMDQPPVQPGDGVAFESSRGDSLIGGRVFGVERYEDRRPERRPRAARQFVLTFDRELDLSAVLVGGEAWKTDDPKIRKQIETSFSRDDIVHRVAISAEVRAVPGGPLTVSLTDGQDRAEAAWPGPLQPAREHPLTAILLREQLGRLGQTPFELAQVTLLGPDGPADELPVMVPKSVLNDLRRRTTDALAAARAARSLHVVANPQALVAMRERIAQPATAPAAPPEAPLLNVLVRDLGQLQAMLEWVPPSPLASPATVYCEFQQLADYAKAAELAHGSNMNLGLALPRIIRPGEEKTLDKILKFRAAVVLVRNLAELEILRRRIGDDSSAGRNETVLVGDHSLNAANEFTMDHLLHLGLSRVTPSCDLSWTQLAAMLPCCPAGAIEIVLHHHLPMFHMQHCLVATNLGVAGETSEPDSRTDGASPAVSCNRLCRSHRIELQDRNGEHHALMCDVLCRNTVHNSHAQSAVQFYSNMRQAGLRHFRVELLRETPQEAQSLVKLYARLLAGESSQTLWQALKSRQPVTRGTWTDKETTNYTSEDE
jgi:putative protease